MLTVHIRKGMIGEDGIATQKVPHCPGLTARNVVLHLQDKLPVEVPIDVGINGRLLTEDEYDIPLQDNDELILCPLTTYGVDWIGYIVYAIISAIVSVAVNYAVQALTPKAKQPDDPFDRGDSKSATYAWNGIRTNYGQGYTVPCVYGRHGAGGQVIWSSTEASEETMWFADTLSIVIALSEGPIYRIGDVICSENDFLGSTSRFPANVPNTLSQGSLPSHLRVNDQLLANDAQSEIVHYEPETTGGWSPSSPTVALGDNVFYFNQTTGANIGQGTATILRITGTTQQPHLFISEQFPAAVTTALLAGNNVRMRLGSAPNAPYIRIENPPSGNPTGLSPFEIIKPASAGAYAFLRSGELAQSPLPTGADVGFSGTRTTFGLNLQFSEYNEEHVWSYSSGTETVMSFLLVFSAPAGLFQTNSSGDPEPYPVEFEAHWKYADYQSWSRLYNVTTTTNSNWEPIEGMHISAAIGSVEVAPIGASQGFGIAGDIEVRVRRLTAAGGVGTASGLVWRDVSVITPYELSYPRTALIGLVLEANNRWNGGLPNCNIRVDGKTIRVWDSSNGWSPRCWDVPDAPFNWHTYPPGRNPAWILADFLLSPWGLGSYLTEDDLDLPAFAAWAVYCDLDPNAGTPWNEPRFTCDIVMDQPRPAWEWVIAICATGAASPVFVNGKISIAYEYRDAHSQGSVSVPAKASTQLFTSGNLQDFAVSWLPRANRPTAFVYQYLNEEIDYKQDVFTAEDYEGTLNDPTELFQDEWRPQQQQAYGTVRTSQLFRDAVLRHRINRLVTRRVDFKTGRWALIGQVGDLIDIETEVLRPFSADVPTSGVVLVGGTSVSSIKVDHTSLPSTGQIKIRNASGAPIVAAWTSRTEGKVENTSVSVLALSSSITVDAGAACVFGTVDKLVETYQITGITITKNLERLVTALQWVPGVHDLIAPTAYDPGNVIGSTATASTEFNSDPLPDQRDVNITRLPQGKQRISWSQQGGTRGATTRIYYRESGSSAWELLGSAEGNHYDTDMLAIGRNYDLSIAPEDFRDQARLAEQGTQVELAPSEFTPTLAPTVAPVVSDQAGYLSWAPVKARGTEEYEIREGEQWVGARTLYRGTEPFVRWDIPPLQTSLSICVEMEDGSQGQPRAIAAPAWVPPKAHSFIAYNVITSGAGTHSNTQFVGTSYLQLTSGSLSGLYTSVSQLPGFNGPFLWRVALDVREYDGVLVDDVLDECDSAEAAWRTIDAREASIGDPGVDFTRSVDDEWYYTVDHYDGEVVSGYMGAAGRHTGIDLEGRFYDGSTWTEWTTWNDEVHTAQTCEVRLNLYRETTKHEVQVHGFTIYAQL